MFNINTYINMAENNVYNADQYRLTNSPKYIYKFMPFYDSGNPMVNNRNIETIQENKVWASIYSNLNDPFEFKSIYLNENKIWESGNLVEDFERVIEDIYKTFLVASFSADGVIHPLNNMPMWAYYGNNHHGICIEYKVINPIMLYPIIYEGERIQIASIVSTYYNLITAAAKGDISIDNKELQRYQFIITNGLCRKHKSWHNENEYRVMFPNLNKDTIGKRIHEKMMGIKIRAIYVGKYCSNRNISKLYGLSKKLGIDIFQMSINDKSNDFEMKHTLLD